jgi:hypothetical protein
MGFQKGQGGRPVGARNKATLFRDTLDALSADKDGQDLHLARLSELVRSADEHVSLKALALVLAYRFGKPTEHIEVAGEGGGPVAVRIIEIRPENGTTSPSGA